jgi:hypothetical protein
MLKIASLLMLTLFLICKPTTAQEAASGEQLAKGFLESLQSGDFESLQRLTPTLPAWRAMAPEVIKNLSDDELREKIDKVVTAKLRKDFNNILEDAKAKGIDLTQLKFSEVKWSGETPRPNDPRGLEVFYTYNEKKGSLALTVTEVDGKYYLREILRSYRVLVQ